MSERRAACPRCGAPVTDSGPLCDDCYLDDFDLLDAPDRVVIAVCNQCGSVKRDDWEDRGDRSIADVAVDAVSEELRVHAEAADVAWRVEIEEVDRNVLRAHVTFTGTVRDRAVEASETVPVRLDRGTCTRCGRIAGDDFGATVQVRAAGEREPDTDEVDDAVSAARDFVGERIEAGDRDAFITEVSETPGGVDLKLSDVGIGASVADRMVRAVGGTVDRSKRLITEEDGEAVYRSTYVVRLPPFRPGDVVATDDAPVVIEHRDPPRGRRLDTGDRVTVDPETATRIGSTTDARETTLVTVEDEHAVQVLDPETFAAETIPRPAYLDPSAETVPVFKSRGGLHVLPTDVPG